MGRDGPGKGLVVLLMASSTALLACVCLWLFSTALAIRGVPAAPSCSASFPYSVSGVQCIGLQQASASDEDACAFACCARNAAEPQSCTVWQFGWASCWIGVPDGGCSKRDRAWVGGAIEPHSTPPPIAPDPRSVRETECGAVEGLGMGSVYVYRGVPYAAAEQRWRPPVPLTRAGRCWRPHVRSSIVEGEGCVDLGGHGVEDCLTLDIWMPKAEARAGRPVMVYFHGGDLTAGAAGDANFERLASHRGGAVIVDVNYRLAAAGFLSIAEMATESADGASGAFGLLDMLESLRWVQRNAASFGGDASRVTIFGQSSGGTAVLALYGSPLSAGLFSRAMSLSGSANISMAVGEQRRQHGAITRAMRCVRPSAAETMACMRRGSLMSGGELQRAVPQGDSNTAPPSSPSWAMTNIFDIPRVAGGLREPGLACSGSIGLPEGGIIPAYRSGAGANVSLVISNMAQECGSCAQVRNVTGADACAAYLSRAFSFVSPAVGAGAARAYSREIEESCQLGFDCMLSDIELTCGFREVARAALHGVGGGARIYSVYNDQRTADCVGGRCYASHGADLAMACSGAGPRADALRDAWIEFASTGRVDSWQTAAGDTMVVLENNGTRSVPGWKAEVCKFWRIDRP